MRVGRRFRPSPGSPRLFRARTGERTEFWTETVGSLPAVYGERWSEIDGRSLRLFEPGRSKLSAALHHGWTGDLPNPGERWLYLGAASGTTASHVADLVGPSGTVYALERSPRPFARLLALSERWPNLLPILADARDPRSYASLVPGVDGIYADIAQPDQLEIVRRNAEFYLSGPGARLIVALKTASMGRDRPAADHLARSEGELDPRFDLAPSVKLDPFHRAHYLIGGRARTMLFGEQRGREVTRAPERSRARPRP